ncbi:MAG: hypothetical protein WCH01_14445, partial [Methylococcaceae bacterium]
MKFPSPACNARLIVIPQGKWYNYVIISVGGKKMGEQKKPTVSSKTRSEDIDPVFDEQVTKLVLDIQNNENVKAN